MKFALELNTEPVTQAAIIVAVVAFTYFYRSLLTIVIYAQSPTVSTFCLVVLAAIVYLVKRVLPRKKMTFNSI